MSDALDKLASHTFGGKITVRSVALAVLIGAAAAALKFDDDDLDGLVDDLLGPE
jgi:hypothetical protein